jgi:hypothetical protein
METLSFLNPNKPRIGTPLSTGVLGMGHLKNEPQILLILDDFPGDNIPQEVDSSLSCSRFKGHED